MMRGEIAISVIIPVWGADAERVSRLWQGNEAPDVEWIVSAVAIGEALRQAEGDRVRIVRGDQPSRGTQMNAGARVARGRLLCFNHADTELTEKHLEALRQRAGEEAFVGGAFHRHFDRRSWVMRRWEWVVHRLERRWLPLFGDQSPFVLRSEFEAMGGFADIPLMEDVEFSRRLRRRGDVCMLYPAIASSPRRFRRLGNLRASLINMTMLGLFQMGVSPEQLHRWYYRTS